MLTLVANAATGDIYVTNPHLGVGGELTYPDDTSPNTWDINLHTIPYLSHTNTMISSMEMIFKKAAYLCLVPY